MFKVVAICGGCASLAVLLGAVNIWLGILSVPILYDVAESLLS
jgi:hypothetical protein